jgi:hypothetical protein
MRAGRRPLGRPVLILALGLAVGLLLLPAGSVARAPTGSPSAAAAPIGAAANNTSWQNLSPVVGVAPSARSISQVAYDPALGAVILFGGYSGAGGNYALGDTWSFSDNSWTELNLTPSPAPRWGATLVYDPAAQALLLFGGRNSDNFFNDTWEYAASGWSKVNTSPAPSPRYDYGATYDAALGAVLLFGGGIGNVPAGTFTGFVFFNDTWSFAHGGWTNLTATAGPAPTGRLLRGQMAYDPADGIALLDGGYSYDALGTASSCGYVSFSTNWSGTWQFKDGAWSAVPVPGAAPPVGMGVLWFDTEANVTLYYEGMWLASGACDNSGNQVWTYSAGNWTLVTEGNLSAPPPVEQPVFVDDEADQEQIVFGGELAANASESFAVYLNDTWSYQPTWLTFRAPGLSPDEAYRVTVSGTVGSLQDHPIVFVESPGRYRYDALLTRGSTPVSRSDGTVTLTHGPASIVLGPSVAPTPAPPSALAAFLAGALPAAAGVAVGVAAVGTAITAAAARRRRRLRDEGDRLVSAMLESPARDPSRNRR